MSRAEDHQSHAIHIAAQAALLHAEGRFAEAMDAGAYAAEVSDVPQAMKQGLVWAVESALALGEPAARTSCLRRSRSCPPGLRAPFLDAQAQRFRARMYNDPEAGFKAAAAGFREYGLPFWLAVTLLEHGELTGDARCSTRHARSSRPGRAPWLERTPQPTRRSARSGLATSSVPDRVSSSETALSWAREGVASVGMHAAARRSTASHDRSPTSGWSPAGVRRGAVVLILVWLVAGPVFAFSSTWQLVINTADDDRHVPHGLRHPEHAEPRRRGAADQAVTR